MIRHLSTTAITRAFGTVLAFAIAFTVARRMELASAGYFFLAQSIANIVCAFSLLGTQHSSVKHISLLRTSEQHDKARGVMLQCFGIFGSFAIVVYFMSMTVAPWLALSFNLAFEIPDHLKYGVLAGLALATVSLLAYYQQAMQRPVLATTAIYIIPPALFMSYMILARDVQLGTALKLYVLSYCVAAVLILVPTAWEHRRQSVTFIRWQTLIRDSRSMWLVSLLHSLSVWGVVAITSLLLLPEELARLALAQRISLVLTLVLFACEMYLAPRYAALSPLGSRRELRKLVLTSTQTLLWLSVVLVTVFAISTKQVLGWFGGEFTAANSILYILLIGQLFNIATGPLGALLMMSGADDSLRKVLYVTVPLMLGIAIVLTHQYGSIGTAVGISVGLIVQKLALTVTVNKKLNIDLGQIFSKH